MRSFPAICTSISAIRLSSFPQNILSFTSEGHHHGRLCIQAGIAVSQLYAAFFSTFLGIIETDKGTDGDMVVDGPLGINVHFVCVQISQALVPGLKFEISPCFVTNSLGIQWPYPTETLEIRSFGRYE